LVTSSNLVDLYRQIRDRRRLGDCRRRQLRQSIFALNEELNLLSTMPDWLAGSKKRVQQDLSYARKITYEE
jgi:hypothetical protein